MKRASVILFVVIALATGCKQQKAQWGKGQGAQQQQQVAVAPTAMKSPEELRQLETLAKANPNNKDAWIALGNAQMDSQRYAEAIIAYQRALDLDPKNVDVRVDMGTCYRGVGQPQRALEEYQRALKIDPRHANALRNSGVVLMDMHRNADAAAVLQKYLDVTPGAPDTAQIQAEIQALKASK